MLRELFQKQQELLENFYYNFDYAQGEKIFEAIARIDGVVFFTGVGKSGFVAQKIAATMMSTGTKALFLSPIDALHGDLGMVTAKDMVVVLSKSGETEELLQLLPALRNKGAQLIAITSNKFSRLSYAVDLSLELPCSGELCPFDLAPTISTALQMLFGDVLAMALMQKKGITLGEYAENHPAGRIGKRASLKVKDLMLQFEKTPLCSPNHTLKEVLIDFTDKRCGCMIVVDSEMHLQGIFTDGDLRRALQKQGERVLQESLQSLMIARPKAIEAEALAWEAMKLMEEDHKKPVMVLPVLEKERVIGLITLHAIIQAGL